MSSKRSHNFSRGLAIIDFILEGDGHSIAEAVEEFNLSRSTIEADLNYVGQELFYGYIYKDSIDLKLKYKKMKETLKRLSREQSANAVKKHQALKKAVSN